LVEAALAQYILPLPTPGKDQTQVDEVAWTDRLLTTMRYLDDEKAHNALMAICGLKQSYADAQLL
jgi:sister chromatid cohesion protein PDS5